MYRAEGKNEVKIRYMLHTTFFLVFSVLFFCTMDVLCADVNNSQFAFEYQAYERRNVDPNAAILTVLQDGQPLENVKVVVCSPVDVPLQEYGEKYTDHDGRVSFSPPESKLVKLRMIYEGEHAFDAYTESFVSPSMIMYEVSTDIAPQIQPITPQQISEGYALVIPVISRGFEETDISLFEGIVLPNFIRLYDEGNGRGICIITPGYKDAGEYTVSVIATDIEDEAIQAETSFTLSVLDVDRPPVIERIGEQMIAECEERVIPVHAYDPDNEDGYVQVDVDTMPSFAEFTDNKLILRPGYNDAGVYKITLTAHEETFVSGSRVSESVLVRVVNINQPPVIEEINDITCAEGESTSVFISAYDPDERDALLTLSAVGLPDFIQLRSNALRISPGYDDAGFYPISIIATEGGYDKRQTTNNFLVHVDNTNRMPVFSDITQCRVREGEARDVILSACDPDHTDEKVTVSVKHVPSFMRVRGNTLRIMPTYGDAGTYTVQLIAHDLDSDRSQEIDFSLSVLSATRHCIGGKISDALGQGISDVLVRIQGGEAVYTDKNGAYMFYDLVPGEYDVFPRKAGFLFSPQTMQVELSDHDMSDQDFSLAVAPIIRIREPRERMSVNAMSIDNVHGYGFNGIPTRITVNGVEALILPAEAVPHNEYEFVSGSIKLIFNKEKREASIDVIAYDENEQVMSEVHTVVVCGRELARKFDNTVGNLDLLKVKKRL